MQSARKSDSDAGTPVPVSSPFTVLWLVLLAMVSIYIRVSGAGSYYFSPDELMHVKTSEGSGLSEVMSFSLYGSHPVLGYIPRHYWMLLSEEPWFVRSLSLIFGIALIPVWYTIGSQLGGRFTGLICASLIAFSHGCIVQSYVVRNYTVFLFFLSSGFYFFLLWRRHPSLKHLLAYGGCCLLACLTHFSGIFAVLAMTAGEELRLFKGRLPLRSQACWVGMNCAVALVTGYLAYLYWQADLSPHYSQRSLADYSTPLLHAFFYPVDIFYYLYPGFITSAAGLLLYLLAWRQNNSELKSLCLLAFFALCIGMLLNLGVIYPFGPSRHSLWMLPFVVSTTGWMLGILCSRLTTHAPSARSSYAMVAVIFILGWHLTNRRNGLRIKANIH